jgi:hypothetical protein
MSLELLKLEANMHSALFVAREAIRAPKWLAFLADIEKTTQTTRHAELLAKNVWLVNFQKAPSALGFLISFAETHAISYRILPLAEPPQWIPVEDSPDHSL